MRKTELVNVVSKETGIVQTDVELIVNTLLDTIRRSVSSGAEVRLREFGIFKTRTRKAKVARNLKGRVNGKRKNPEALILPACEVPHFKASKQFLNA